MDAMDAEQVLAEGWYVPKGRYNIMIGSGSQKIELMQTISVDGMELKSPKWQKDSWYETLVGEPHCTPRRRAKAALFALSPELFRRVMNH